MSTKKSKFEKIRKNKKASGGHLYYFFHVPLILLYTITSSWCGRFDTPCINLKVIFSNVLMKRNWTLKNWKQ
jgi:hypothetical protein